MSIILYHKGCELPNHLKDCITKIRQYSNIPIYLISDSFYDQNNVININVNGYNDFNWLYQIPFLHFKSNDRSANMWRESSFRLFHINKLIQEKNLSNVLTFDNDILLYENPETLIELMDTKYDNLAITPNSYEEVAMAMMYIKNPSSFEHFINMFKKELSIPIHELHNKYKGYPTEMRILSNYDKFDMLPILPENITEKRYTNNFNYFNGVFDPSSYGQFLGGLSPLNESVPNPGWYHDYYQIGKYIKNKSISIYFENNNPHLIYQGTKIKILNLHIHSKQTFKFM